MRFFARAKQYISSHWFLFEELVKRDFKGKYKGTVLGMGWSILSPIMQLFVMKMVFTQFFGRNSPHYTTYLFSGLLIYHYFRDASKSGLGSLMANAKIISRVKVPKYIFLLSRNVSAVINFFLTICVYFVFCAFDGITFSWRMLALLYPMLCLMVFNIGVGMILSALYVFFRDTSYLYDIFILLLRYLCAIFYQIDRFSPKIQRMFLMNPIYCYIKYFRTVVIDGMRLSSQYHLLCAGYALAVLVIGILIYRKCNVKFLYYM